MTIRKQLEAESEVANRGGYFLQKTGAKTYQVLVRSQPVSMGAFGYWGVVVAYGPDTLDGCHAWILKRYEDRGISGD